MTSHISLSRSTLLPIVPPPTIPVNAVEVEGNDVKAALVKSGSEQLFKQTSENLLKLNVRLSQARQSASDLLETPGPELAEYIAASQLHSHVVSASLRGLAAASPVEESIVAPFFTASMQQLQELNGGPGTRTVPATYTSSDDFFSDLLGMIDFIRNGYLAIYENLITQYSTFFKEFNEEIMSKMGGWISGVNDGKDVKIEPGLRNALDALINKYSRSPGGVLYPPPNTGGSTAGSSRADAENWAETLGLPASSVVSDNRGGFVVMMDLSPLLAMRDSS
jgi:type III secretion system IpaD/SipD/SspD family effector